MAPAICSLCSMTLSSPSMLKVHYNLHCNICKKLFMCKFKLKEHMDMHSTTTLTNTHDATNFEICPICNTSISKKMLNVHKNLHCQICKKLFMSAGKLNEHREAHNTTSPPHINPNVSYKHCKDCNVMIPTSSYLTHIRTSNHKNKCEKVSLSDKLTVRKSDFEGRIQTYSFLNKKEEILFPEEFFNSAKEIIVKQLEECSLKHTTFKFNFELLCEYMKVIDDDFKIAPMGHISKMSLITKADDMAEIYEKHANEVCIKMEEFQERDSGWTLISIITLEININKASIIRGSSFIPLPKSIAFTKGLINIENKDDFCFKWCLIAALYTDENLNFRQRKNCNIYNISSIENARIALGEMELNFEGMQFPLELKQIKLFEKKNIVSINVFGHNGKSIIGPYYVTCEEKEKHINLLLLHSGEKFHYVLINDISKLLRSSITSHRGKLFICNTCLYYTHDEQIHNNHKQVCGKKITLMPKPENAFVMFKNYQKQLNVPFVIYADFESILEKTDEQVSSSTCNVQKHIACAFGYFIKCNFKKENDRHRYYFGEDASKIFVEKIVYDATEIYTNHLSKVQQMVMKPDELDLHKRSEICHICHKLLYNDKVRDHCHLTGTYRGAAHNECNLKYQTPKFIPVVFHNLSAYDMHLFFKELSSIQNASIKVIPLNKERYISLSVYIKLDRNHGFEIRFIDSFRFMASSLDSLAKNLDICDFHTVRDRFTDENQCNLIRRKGVFPYSYMDSLVRFSETELPSRDKFFNILNNEECPAEEYEHAQKVWNEFNCKTLLDYTELYLKTDVLLLADIFENFRKICKSIYNLDPCHYYTAPGLSWDAMLKTTEIRLDLFTDSDMYMFMQNGIRGGLVQCSKRYAKANHKYMNNFDESKPSEYLMYLDANNLYGWAMSEYLPYGGFEWLSHQDLNYFDVNKISDTSEYGFVLEVDIEYPDSLHDYHNDLPFCPQNKITGKSKCKKLIADLTFKNKYTIHYRVLKQCISEGLVLKKVHRILKFKQSPWLQKYIQLNTFHRTNAKNAFEKDFFKLLNNAVYGKTMESVDKRKDIRIATKWENTNKNHLGLRSLISKPNFQSLCKFSDDMYAVELKKMDSCYDKPIYIGFTVLELSKWKMYNFHYNYMKPKFDEKLSLNYMDTDSFIYSIQTNDFYDDIRNDIKMNFDTSEYKKDNHFNFPNLNKKVLGMMKDENNGNVMTEFVGLRSKMYSLSSLNSDDIKKSKGVKKSVIQKLSINDYKDCLFEQKILTDEMYLFRSKAHQLYTQKIHKVVLSHTDDKRKIMIDRIKTRAWGHYKDRVDNNFMDIDEDNFSC